MTRLFCRTGNQVTFKSNCDSNQIVRVSCKLNWVKPCFKIIDCFYVSNTCGFDIGSAAGSSRQSRRYCPRCFNARPHHQSLRFFFEYAPIWTKRMTCSWRFTIQFISLDKLSIKLECAKRLTLSLINSDNNFCHFYSAITWNRPRSGDYLRNFNKAGSWPGPRTKVHAIVRHLIHELSLQYLKKNHLSDIGRHREIEVVVF